jgi:hypothetical protein
MRHVSAWNTRAPHCSHAGESGRRGGQERRRGSEYGHGGGRQDRHRAVPARRGCPQAHASFLCELVPSTENGRPRCTSRLRRASGGADGEASGQRGHGGEADGGGGGHAGAGGARGLRRGDAAGEQRQVRRGKRGHLGGRRARPRRLPEVHRRLLVHRRRHGWEFRQDGSERGGRRGQDRSRREAGPCVGGRRRAGRRHVL